MKLAALAPLALLVAGPIACGATSGSETSAPESNTADGGADAGPSVACANLPPGPLTPARVGAGALFSGSEDFAFDGQGHIIGKRGNALVAVSLDPAVAARPIAQLPGQTYGVRYLPDGDLVAAIPGAGKVVRVKATGEVIDLSTGLAGPNGVYADVDGSVWVTEFSGGRVSRLAADGTRSVVVSGANAQAANGIVVDGARRLAFYTEYQRGKIHRVSTAGPGATPVQVAQISGAALDGMVLDACGNVYVVDQGRSRLFRVKTDATGSAVGAPELLATFPTNVANAQFGAGPGFDPTKLYVTGNPGTVYALDVGVAGAPVPTPSFD